MADSTKLNIQPGYRSWIDTPARKKSGELDFGANWLLHGRDGQPRFPHWRISWIMDTGELYAYDGHNQFIQLATIADREGVENTLKGWSNYRTPFYQNLAALQQHLSYRSSNVVLDEYQA